MIDTQTNTWDWQWLLLHFTALGSAEPGRGDRRTNGQTNGRMLPSTFMIISLTSRLIKRNFAFSSTSMNGREVIPIKAYYFSWTLILTGPKCLYISFIWLLKMSEKIWCKTHITLKSIYQGCCKIWTWLLPENGSHLKILNPIQNSSAMPWNKNENNRFWKCFRFI